MFPADLLAMCIQESECNMNAIGDSGKSIGAFQINTFFHKIPKEKISDFTYQVDWTANRLKNKGYDKNSFTKRKNSIMKHNGSNDSAWEYAGEVMSISNNIHKINNIF